MVFIAEIERLFHCFESSSKRGGRKGREEGVDGFPEIWLCCGYLQLSLSLSQLEFSKENWILEQILFNPIELWHPGSLLTFKHVF